MSDATDRTRESLAESRHRVKCRLRDRFVRLTFLGMREPGVHLFASLCAIVQLVSPGVAAVADGFLAIDSVSQPRTHIEASSGASCRAVHSPDCAVCRYLSSAVMYPAPSSAVDNLPTLVHTPRTDLHSARAIRLDLPFGRAPPRFERRCRRPAAI